MMQQPYKKDYLNQFYEQFFCEDYSVYVSADEKPVYPFDVLASSDTAALEKIAADPDMESRVRLLAYRRLASLGIPITEKTLLGVIVEVDMEQGLDTLAVYADGSARLIGQAENMIIWEQRTKESDELISRLFNDSKNVVAMIGPWTEDRLPHPAAGEVRLNGIRRILFWAGAFRCVIKRCDGRTCYCDGNRFVSIPGNTWGDSMKLT